MAFTAPNTVAVQMFYTVGGEIVENVYHAHKDSAWDLTSLGALAAAFVSWETSDAADQRSEQVSLIRVVATDLTDLTSGRVDNKLVAPVDGTIVSPALPGNVTWAVKQNIGERGRGRNGRTFWIGLAETQVIGNIIDTATANSIQTALNALITDIPAAVPGAALGVMHRPPGDPPIGEATFSPTQSFTYTDLFVDSQRDRLPGHKRHKKPATPTP